MQQMKYSAKEEQLLMSKIWGMGIKNDPEAFVLFAFPWGKKNTPLEKMKGPRKWQLKVLRKLKDAILDNNLSKDFYKVFRHSTSSGRGVGKSALVSWLCLWMQSTRIGSTVIISANSENQLRSVTWGELTKWAAMLINEHWFEVSATRLFPAKWLTELVENDLKKGTRYWGVEGKLWSEENPDAYAGVHNMDGTMVIFDEASGIPDSIWSVASGFFTENIPDRYWFAFSNPRRNSGYFFECFNSKRNFWETMIVSGKDVEGVDQNVYDQIIAEYGENSMEARIEVFGEFPEAGDEQFISAALIDEAIKRKPYNDKTAPIIIGVDPARSGMDSTVILIRSGRDIVDIKRFRGCDTMETVGNVIDAIREYNPALTVIDEGGLGYGILDRLTEQKFKVRGVNFGWKSKNPAAWGNKRAEMWGAMRDWLRTASIPNDRQLKIDLTSPQTKPNSAGTIYLEGKKEMKARGLSSPDSADALAVTFAFPVGHHGRQMLESNGGTNSFRSKNLSSNYNATSWMGS